MIDASPPAVTAPPSTTGTPDRNGGPPSTPTSGPVPPDQPLSPRNRSKAHALGLTSATGLVIGSIVGTGVFTMPAVMAGAGTMGIIVLGVIAVGAMLLAILFGQLTKRVPNSDGGLYAYSRHEFGDFAGYLVGWCYWIQAWAGNAAIVSSWVFYVDALFGWAHISGMENWGIAMVGLWVPAIINLVGRPPDGLVPERHRRAQVPAPAVRRRRRLVLRPAAAHFGPFNASGGSLYSGIGIAAGVALFSFIGVEAAAMTAKRVKNPRINVSRASLLGTALSAILYVLVTAVVMGLVAHHTLVGTGSPFVNAFQTHLPPPGLGREVHRRHRRHLRHRSPQRLDPDRHRDVAGHGPGRPVPPAVRLDRQEGHGLVRHPGRHGPAVAADAVALQRPPPASPSSPTWSTSPWSPWPSPTSCRPSPSSPTWCPAAGRCRAGCWPGTCPWPAPACCSPCG